MGRERRRKKISYWKMKYLETPEEEGKFSVRKNYNFIVCGKENKK